MPASFAYILCSSNFLLFSLSLFPHILNHSFLSSFLPTITFLAAFLSSFLPTFVPIFFLYSYFYLLSLISNFHICLQFISEMICCGRLTRRDQIYEFVRCTLMYVQHPLQKVRSRVIHTIFKKHSGMVDFSRTERQATIMKIANSDDVY